MSDISDTAQTLAAVAAFALTPTRVRGIGFIRAKETDRIAAIVAELTARRRRRARGRGRLHGHAGRRFGGRDSRPTTTTAWR